MNGRRFSLCAVLTLFLLIPAFPFVFVKGYDALCEYLGLDLVIVWFGSVVALFWLCAAYLEKEPGLIRFCLVTMVLFALVALLCLPSIAS